MLKSEPMVLTECKAFRDTSWAVKRAVHDRELARRLKPGQTLVNRARLRGTLGCWGRGGIGRWGPGRALGGLAAPGASPRLSKPLVRYILGMKQMNILWRLIGVCLSGALLAACGGPGTLTSQSASQSGLPAQRGTMPVTPAGKSNSPTLYVLNSGGGKAFAVTVYSDGGASLLRSISFGEDSEGFTVDPLGHFYVAFPETQGDPGGPGLLNIYGSRGAKVLRTLHQRHPFGLLTIDGSGNLYTLCANARVCEYASAKQHVIRKIALGKFGSGRSTALATDASGNLASDSLYGPVLVFAPGATEPYWKITTGIDFSTALAFDAAGDLYVVNFGNESLDPGSVAVYAPGSSSPMRTITDGVVKPSALAFDGAGNLYVLNYCIYQPSSGCAQAPAVTVYAPGGVTPIRTITTGIGGAGALTLDQSADLYVANSGSTTPPSDPGSVTVYAPGGSSPMRTVTQDVQNPVALGLGP